MALRDDFLAEVEAFLAGRAMRATTFGWRALGDPRLVFELREGRSPSLCTIERVRAFMADVTQKAEGAR